MAGTTLDERIRRNSEKLRELRKRRARAARSATREERAARTHALIVFGGLLASHVPESDWRRIDPESLSDWLDRNSESLRNGITRGETTTVEARDSLRRWETERRYGKTESPDDAEPEGRESGRHFRENG